MNLCSGNTDQFVLSSFHVSSRACEQIEAHLIHGVVTSICWTAQSFSTQNRSPLAPKRGKKLHLLWLLSFLLKVLCKLLCRACRSQFLTENVLAIHMDSESDRHYWTHGVSGNGAKLEPDGVGDKTIGRCFDFLEKFALRSIQNPSTSAPCSLALHSLVSLFWWTLQVTRGNIQLLLNWLTRTLPVFPWHRAICGTPPHFYHATES